MCLSKLVVVSDLTFGVATSTCSSASSAADATGFVAAGFAAARFAACGHTFVEYPPHFFSADEQEETTLSAET